MYYVCNTGALSDVRGSNRIVADDKSRGRMHEPKSRVRRLDTESVADGGIQPSGRAGDRGA